MTPKTEVRQLRRSDDRSQFRCGDPDLDRFFQKYASQNQFKHHLGTTYVAVEGKEIVGFVTVSASSISIDELSRAVAKRLPRYPLPVLRIARLAVADTKQGGGIGSLLLRAAFKIAHDLAERAGCVGVLVDAKRGREPYYEALGFERLKLVEGALGDRPVMTTLFLELDAIPRIEEG